ncbi:YXWGXW repeat-containing protein [Paracidovorax anthurii]|uniref:YXWGXW repeat-containing protein n=1 Tax=Paracidovorax anthurii TaxID=78229 RepID=A0A328YUW7_9BURK|nr:YXWGXW repeat-containing protein [Paracidovorax anthurii]RAR77550.1 YXWGXW repeat-containing protein [Paracidovorax anthurii]
MTTRKALSLTAASIALASVLGTVTTAARAATSATVIVQSGPQYVPAAPMVVQYPAPPAPRYERVPPPRRGMVWEQGHWEWRGHRHVWVPGHWLRARPGYAYRQPAWVQNDGRWEMRRGGWDRDGDGVPNRYDRRPDNPYRR